MFTAVNKNCSASWTVELTWENTVLLLLTPSYSVNTTVKHTLTLIYTTVGQRQISPR